MVGIKSVLLVLDDVDDRKMLEALATSGAIRWFKSGSRIIITTRQKEILEFAGLRGDAVYMLEELDKQESLQLFKYHAFGDQEPQEEYIKLSKEVVSISNGLPLVLQVFGSLFKTAETPEECDQLLKDLRTRRQVGGIHEKLRICYDSLNWNEQYIFLDIACLLVGKSSEDAIYIWEGSNVMQDLNKGLMSVLPLLFSNQTLFDGLKVLDLSCCGCLNATPNFAMAPNLEKLILDECNMLKEVDSIGSLRKLDVAFREWDELGISGSRTSPYEQEFCFLIPVGMAVLEELILDHCKCLLKVGESIGQLNNLTLLSMVGCENLGALPCGILQLNSLQLLSLEGCSRIKILPEANMMDVRLDSLQQLILDNCTSLTEIPDYVGGLKCLRCLSLKDCFSLQRLPRSIGSLVVLEELILDHCKCLLEVGESIGQLNNLNILSMVGCENLGDLPCGMLQLNSLQVLNLQSCSRIKILPEASMMDVRLETLQRLILDHCASLTEIPDYVVALKCLRSLSLQGCSSLERISFSIGSLVVLEELILDHCTSLTEMPDLSNLTALQKLNVENCRSLATIPGLQNLTSLKVLYMNGCWDLDVHKIWSELKDATFHNLQAFSIGCKIWHGAKTISLPFPRRGRTRRVPLQLERMDLAVIKMSVDEIMACGIKVAEDATVLDVGVAVGSRLFPAAEDLEAQQEEAPYYRYCRSYTAGFGLDDVIMINARLRKDLEAQQEEAPFYRYCYSYIASDTEQKRQPALMAPKADCQPLLGPVYLRKFAAA
ncbi:TMV resistance protein [Nymphaea thermarum]|nr:TMV resistance protein [Nymphaea thermarum]